MSDFSKAETEAAAAIIRLALAEDLDILGDVTSQATIPLSQSGAGIVALRAEGVVAGLPILPLLAEQVDPRLTVQILLNDGQNYRAGAQLAKVKGPLRSLLLFERTALNFLQRLSGIATLTRRYVDAVAGLPVQVLDTRKTTPGYRLLEKYAVRQGGGTNHRVGLYDGVLIKDNHIAPFGSGQMAIERALNSVRKASICQGLPLEIEVDTLEQFSYALGMQPDIILLDNMSNAELREAVQLRNEYGSKVLLEASGGVNLQTIRGIAETGVDRISVGALTHSAVALDLGLDFEPTT